MECEIHPYGRNNSVKSQFLLLKRHACVLFFMNHLCSGTIMHPINISFQHFLSTYNLAVPHKVHFKQQIQSCHQFHIQVHTDVACLSFSLSLGNTHMHTFLSITFNQRDKAGAESYLTVLHLIN